MSDQPLLRSEEAAPTQPAGGGESPRDADIRLGRDVLEAEARAIAATPLDARFAEAAEAIHAATTPPQAGSLIVCGMGKSGLVGAKLSATFASTGTPSQVLHPTEALHGDLGRIRAGDAVLLLSYGGQTEEVVALGQLLRQDGLFTAAITGSARSDLGRCVGVCLEIGPVTEACPLNLAPTASTAAMMALGDALALAVSRRRRFGAEDFHRFHPGGSLGRRLMPVTEAMRMRAGENLAVAELGTTLRRALEQAEAPGAGKRRAGALLVVDAEGRLAGILTDADLRRALLRESPSVLERDVGELMVAGPRRLSSDAVVADAVSMVREHRIDELPIVDGADRPVGLIDVQDLVALRVIEI